MSAAHVSDESKFSPTLFDQKRLRKHLAQDKVSMEVQYIRL